MHEFFCCDCNICLYYKWTWLNVSNEFFVTLKTHRVFPIIAPHEIIDPPLWYKYHDGGGGAKGYLSTKVGGGYNGKNPTHQSIIC